VETGAGLARTPGRKDIPPRRTVLLVDDQEGILDSLEAALEDDFIVLRAQSAGEALRHLSRGFPNLVFLDLMMPGMSGFNLLREIRQMGVPCRIVMLTVSAREENREEALLLGVDAYLLKPFDVRNIIATARTLGLGGGTGP